MATSEQALGSAQVRAINRSRSLRRRLTTEHYAFLRGLAQGAEPRGLWLRYMVVEGKYDERLL